VQIEDDDDDDDGDDDDVDLDADDNVEDGHEWNQISQPITWTLSNMDDNTTIAWTKRGNAGQCVPYLLVQSV